MKKSATVKPTRPRLPKITEEMKAWSAALGTEVMTWPGVTTRPMFGLTALYRARRIFAVLPRTRCMDVPNSIAFKLESAGSRIRARAQRDPHISFFGMQNARWLSFEMNCDADLHPALQWLSRAYEAAG
jgi:hypothetical protein